MGCMVRGDSVQIDPVHLLSEVTSLGYTVFLPPGIQVVEITDRIESVT